MPLCWIFLLKRRRALSKVSFSPTRTSANLGSPPTGHRFGPIIVRPEPVAGHGCALDAGCPGVLAGAAGDVGTSAARRAGGVYTSPADGSSDGSETIGRRPMRSFLGHRVVVLPSMHPWDARR